MEQHVGCRIYLVTGVFFIAYSCPTCALLGAEVTVAMYTKPGNHISANSSRILAVFQSPGTDRVGYTQGVQNCIISSSMSRPISTIVGE